MLEIKQSVLEEMSRDAVEAFPDECCGFFFGIEKNDIGIASEVLVVKNIKEGDKRRRFEISSKDYLKAEQYAEENELQLLGVYHSHPDHPAKPSEHDRVAAQPNFSYIIISVIAGAFADLRSWRLNEENQFVEEQTIAKYINL